MGLGDWWSATKERLRFRYAPSVANRLISLSTFRARKELAQSAPLKVLVDNTVLNHAVTHETAWISTGPKMWGHLEVPTGYAARVPVHAYDANTREYRSIRYLAGIAHLSRIGCIELHTSAELQDEKFRQPFGRYHGYGYEDYSLFRGVEITSIDGFGISDEFGVSIAYSPFAKSVPREDRQRERLKAKAQTDALYAALVERLGQANSQDAWHVRTAEHHGMFCFLTMDFKLTKTVKAQSGSETIRSLKTLVLTPEEFGKRFDLLPISPRILSYNNVSFFVRADLTMPEGKRRPLSAYRKGERKPGEQR